MGLHQTPPDVDLVEILCGAEDDMRALAGASVLVTGGTGFVGTWIVAALATANRSLQLGMHVTVLARHPRALEARLPTLASTVTLVAGDIRTPPRLTGFSHVVHAASPADAALNDADPALMASVNAEGMRQIINACSAADPPRFLFTSSGAVYGPQPADLERVPEAYEPPPNAALSAYARGKRTAETMAAEAHAEGRIDLRLARLFTFAGPLLPLDGSFAVGNFVRDALNHDRIVIAGDGSAVRSYLYPTDMVRALLAVLVRGEGARPYNVGSPVPVSIRQLAERIRRVVNPGLEIEVRGATQSSLPTGAGHRYVPDCSRLATELDVHPSVDLDDAIRRYAAWAEATRSD